MNTGIYISSRAAAPPTRIVTAARIRCNSRGPVYPLVTAAEMNPLVTRASFNMHILQGSPSLHLTVIVFTNVGP